LVFACVDIVLDKIVHCLGHGALTSVQVALDHGDHLGECGRWTLGFSRWLLPPAFTIVEQANCSQACRTLGNQLMRNKDLKDFLNLGTACTFQVMTKVLNNRFLVVADILLELSFSLDREANLSHQVDEFSINEVKFKEDVLTLVVWRCHA